MHQNSHNLPSDITSLMQCVAGGDDKAFLAIFEAYKKVFFSVAYKMTHDESVSEEIVQEVFVTLWVKRVLIAQAIHTEDYIFTILHNAIYKYFRKQAQEFRLKQKLQLVAESSEAPIEKSLWEKEQHHIFEALISRMPAQQQKVYIMAKQQELSREEIAEKLNLSPNTVRNHLAAAVQFLRQHLLKEVYTLLCAVIIKHL